MRQRFLLVSIASRSAKQASPAMIALPHVLTPEEDAAIAEDPDTFEVDAQWGPRRQSPQRGPARPLRGMVRQRPTIRRSTADFEQQCCSD